jgi:hypothetical protein
LTTISQIVLLRNNIQFWPKAPDDPRAGRPYLRGSAARWFAKPSCIFPTEAKSALIDAVARAGVREIEAESFVPPKVVPQFVDIDAVMMHALSRKTTTIGALVPNPKGAERATAAGVNRRSPSSIRGSPWPVYDLFDTNEARSFSLPIVGEEQ